MTEKEIKERDRKVIIFLLRTYKNELESVIKPDSNYAFIRYMEVYSFLNGYTMGTNHRCYKKLMTAEKYLDALVNKYNVKYR